MTTALFLAPAVLLLGVWLVYPLISTFGRSFFDPSGERFVGLDNYLTVLSSDSMGTALKNNVIWLAVVPLAITALGLVFAVLTERIRWAVAFKLAVFMPMAISLFAAGVIWRVMDDQDPERGALNATISVIRDAFAPEGILTTAQASSPELRGSPSRGFTGADAVGPSDSALLGLTGILETDIPPGAEQAEPVGPVGDGVVGTVWRDFHPGGGKPGVVDAQEVGLPGATVELLGRRGRVVATTTAGADGAFRFPDVAPGEYRVRVAPQTFEPTFEGVPWLGPALIVPAVMVAYIWVWAGFAMVLIAAGLSAISREVLEAARIDGANEWQVFRHVTAPMLTPVLSVVLVTLAINVLKVFDIVLSIAPGSSQDDATVIALEMWRVSFGGQSDFGRGSAIAMLLFLLVLPVLVLNIRRFRREQS